MVNAAITRCCKKTVFVSIPPSQHREHDRSGENGDQVPAEPMAKSSRPAERCRGSVRSGIIADHETGRQGGTAGR